MDADSFIIWVRFVDDREAEAFKRQFAGSERKLGDV